MLAFHNRAGATALAAALAATLTATGIRAADAPASVDTVKTAAALPSDVQLKVIRSVTVVGPRAATIPGAVQRVTAEELSQANQAFDDIHRVMMRLPGVVVLEEDGYGLRPNIGLRAAGSDRSANITLMEDGILAAPAPYSAPAAYYFPVTGRMEGVEVRKGSSQIKYGPRSNGGALNLLSTSIPDDRMAHARVSAGSHDSRKLHANYGDAWKRISWMLEAYQSRTDGFKQLDTGGNTGFDVEDYVGKVRVASSPDAARHQEFSLKLGYKDEISNETYLGLTDADFAGNPYRRYAASQHDVMDNDHTQAVARHFIAASDAVDVTTSVYRNEFRRNWYKLDRVNGAALGDVLADPGTYATEYAYLTGDSTSADNALAVKSNNREYYAQGIESVAGIGFDGAGFTNELEVGLRYHEDEEDRLQRTDRYRMETGGTMTLTTEGTPGGSGGGDNRVGSARAVAAFAQNEMRRGDWSLVPGVRVEWIDTEVEQYAANDPGRAIAPTVTSNSTTAVVPGIGATYHATRWLDAFAGVHRGFAPPGPGADDATIPEESINYEAGIRTRARGLEFNFTGYYNDYENLLGKDTFSSGGTGSGDLFNAGAVEAWGAEVSATYTHDAGTFAVPLTAAYTYSHAEFRSSFESTYEPWGTVETGDELPYIPGHVLAASAGVQTMRFHAGVFANYTGEMRAVAGQGDIPASEATDARVIVDLTAEYELMMHARVFASMQNVADEAYIASRLPAGVRPGLPRTFIAGLKFDL